VAKRKSGRLQVFKGREAKLNRAIFHTLTLRDPQTIYKVCKEVKALRQLKHTKYTNVNRRVRALQHSGYLEKASVRKTKAGFQATLYQLSARAYLALMLNQIDIETILQKADKTAVLSPLSSSLISQIVCACVQVFILKVLHLDL
jgi:hypothetical protein